MTIRAKTVEIWHGLQCVRYAAVSLGDEVQLFRVPDPWSSFFPDQAALERKLVWVAEHFTKLQDNQAVFMDERERS